MNYKGKLKIKIKQVELCKMFPLSTKQSNTNNNKDGKDEIWASSMKSNSPSVSFLPCLRKSENVRGIN